MRSSAGLSPSPGPRESHASQIIVFLASILTATASVAALYAQLPWWFAYSIALFALTSAVVLVREFIWPPVHVRISTTMERRRLDAASKVLFLDFEHLVHRFQEFISTRRNDTLAACFIELRNQDSAWRTKLPAVPQIIFMSELFRPFQQRLQKWDGSYRELNELAQEFFTFLNQHDSMYVREPLNVIRSLKREEVPENLRNKVNLLRENYASFLRDYMSFAQRANSRLGLNPFIDFMNLPEPI